MAKFTKDIKKATEITKKINEDVEKFLDFSNEKDFEDAKRGFIATDENLFIKERTPEESWNIKNYEFLEEDWEPTVNPSLWRQAKLNYYNGLFKVIDRVYQVRTYDLSNITIIEGDSGLIIIDPLISGENAKAAMELYYKEIGEKPVVAVIYSHSHIDHYGGVKGVISQEQVDNGEVEVIAPEGFLEEAISENVFAGTAMLRRADYMYGSELAKSKTGQVDDGLGKDVSKGVSSLIAPTKIVSKTGEKLNVDGIEIECIMASGTEAPAEFMMYFPQFKLMNFAEVVTHNTHNIYTLRGAKVRDARKWWKAIDNVIALYEKDIEVGIAQHHWPTWENSNIMDLLTKQRDAYKFLHDQSLRLANQGYNGTEIGELVKLPKSLEKEWSLRDYYGSFNHDAKAIYQFYLGWYDGNPANLYALPPEEVGKRYVELAGGVEEAIKKGKESFDKGDYRWVAELMKHVVFADPSNEQARYLEADALEQLGYQTENGPWRNAFLTGAKELREEIKPTVLDNSDSLLAMPTELVMDYAGILVDYEKAEGKEISLNLKLTDRNEKYHISLQNSVLVYRKDYIAKNEDFELIIDIPTFIGLIFKKIDIKKVTSDSSKFKGDSKKIEELIKSLNPFAQSFNIVTP